MKGTQSNERNQTREDGRVGRDGVRGEMGGTSVVSGRIRGTSCSNDGRLPEPLMTNETDLRRKGSRNGLYELVKKVQRRINTGEIPVEAMREVVNIIFLPAFSLFPSYIYYKQIYLL